TPWRADGARVWVLLPLPPRHYCLQDRGLHERLPDRTPAHCRRPRTPPRIREEDVLVCGPDGTCIHPACRRPCHVLCLVSPCRPDDCCKCRRDRHGPDSSGTYPRRLSGTRV